MTGLEKGGRSRRQTFIGPENHEFLLVAYERIQEHDFHVLEVTPRIKNKFLFRGRIWVEGQDFAVASSLTIVYQDYQILETRDGQLTGSSKGCPAAPGNRQT
jgi:hypothetical protein